MSTSFEVEWVPQAGGWVHFEKVTCDLCPEPAATYPANGLHGECARMEAVEWYGWDIDRMHGRACCPDCYRRIYNVADA